MLAPIYNAATNAGSKTKSEVFTSAGTFTAPHAGWYEATLQGASGGTGGCQTTGSPGTARSGGSGPGQTVFVRFYLPDAGTAAIAVGTAGTAGTFNTAGGNGGDTTITVDSIVYRARGGLGATSVTSAGGATTNGNGARGGQTIIDAAQGKNAVILAGGVIEAANGNAGGQTARGGSCGAFTGGTSGTTAAGGGGASPYGAGGNGATVQGVGQIGQGPGAGSGGSLILASLTTVAGVAGVAGFARVDWIGN